VITALVVISIIVVVSWTETIHTLGIFLPHIFAVLASGVFAELLVRILFVVVKVFGIVTIPIVLTKQQVCV
jgi:hypothetical protein